MRVQFIINKHNCIRDVNASMALILRDYLASHGCQATDHAPDIIHVFGRWNNQYARIIRHCYNYKIPIVFTAIDGIQSLADKENGSFHLNISPRQIIRYSSVIHTSGPMEEKLVKHVCKEAETCIIQNPAITASLTNSEMGNKMYELYKDTIGVHDRRIRNDIEAKVAQTNTKIKEIDELCSEILYIKYLTHRRNIPKETIDNLTEKLLQTQYDEDIMAETMEELKIDKFAASLFYVLCSISSLSEGFVPTYIKYDRTAQFISKSITN